MNLSYRGIPYQPTVFEVEVSETNQSGQFLGKTYKLVHTNVAQRQTPVALRYRGISYSA